MLLSACNAAVYSGESKSSRPALLPTRLPTGFAYSGPESQIIPQASVSILGEQWGLKVPQAESTVLWSFSVSNSATECHPAMLGMRSITRGLARLPRLLPAPGVQTSQYSLTTVREPGPTVKLALVFSPRVPAGETKEMKRWGGKKWSQNSKVLVLSHYFKRDSGLAGVYSPGGECLPTKQKALESIPSNTKNKIICNIWPNPKEDTQTSVHAVTVKILDPKWPLLSHPLTPRFFTTYLSNVKALDTGDLPSTPTPPLPSSTAHWHFQVTTPTSSPLCLTSGGSNRMMCFRTSR